MFRLCLAAALATGVFAQTEERGWTLQTRLDGTVNTLGIIARLDPVLGYRFNRYATVEAGLPFYFVSPSASALPVLGAASGSGIGNAHLALRLSFQSPAITYQPSLTVTAPTGDEDRGLSTGEVTYDWNNLFLRTFGRATPYASAGISNTVADTPFFVRPFTSQGLVGHAEGGALLSLSRRASLGGSLYAIEPSGEQKVISRIVKPEQTYGAGTTEIPGGGKAGQGGDNSGRSRRKTGVFETAARVEGPAEIARDRGGSLWVTVTPRPALDFTIGYSRSTTYALNTLFFGIGVKFF